MKKNNVKIKYDKESDILMWELSEKARIDYATEMGDFIVHFTKNNLPVLIEVLNASKFIRQNEERLKYKRYFPTKHIQPKRLQLFQK